MDIEPMFSCQNQDCAVEVSYPAEMLHLYNGKPICDECYDHETNCDDDCPTWAELPPFVPAYQAEITRLRANREDVIRECAAVAKNWNGETRDGDTDHISDAILALVDSQPVDDPLLDEVVEGYTYDDWEDDAHDDDKVRIGDYCHFNFQDHNGVDREEFDAKIIRHPDNGIPVALVNMELAGGDVSEDAGDYVSLQSLFMSGFSFCRISEKDLISKLEGTTNEL